MYKSDNFKFELLEVGFRTKQTLLLREYELINTLKECYYNIDRICPIIKEVKPKKVKNKPTISSGKSGIIISTNTHWPKKAIIKLGSIKKPIKYIKESKIKAVKSTAYAQSILAKKLEREANKVKRGI